MRVKVRVKVRARARARVRARARARASVGVWVVAHHRRGQHMPFGVATSLVLQRAFEAVAE